MFLKKCFLGVTHLADFGSHFGAKIHGFPDRQSSSIKQIQELPGSPGMPRQQQWSCAHFWRRRIDFISNILI